MTYTITCRDCPTVFESKSKLTQLCQPCKARRRKEYQDYFKSLRQKRRRNKPTAPPKEKPPIMTDQEQHRINRYVDDLGVNADHGRCIPPGSTEFNRIARQYYSRDCRA